MLDFLDTPTLDLIFKLGFLILNGVYIIFLIIVLQQAKAMSRVIHDSGASSLINFIALANIVIGILIFVAALVIL